MIRHLLFALTLSCGTEVSEYPTKELKKLTISWETTHVPNWDQIETAYAVFEEAFGAVSEPWEVYFTDELFVDVFGLTTPDDKYSQVLYDTRICRTAFLHELLHVRLYQLHPKKNRVAEDADPFHDDPRWLELIALEAETCAD